MDTAQIATALRALLAEIDGAPTPTADDAPPGFVYVKPTGPRGAGKRRLWPEIVETISAGGITAPSGTGYARRMSTTFNPDTNRPYFEGHSIWLVGDVQSRYGGTFPEVLDRMMYPFDWMPQEELDRQEAMAERDRAEGNRFSGG